MIWLNRVMTLVCVVVVGEVVWRLWAGGGLTASEKALLSGCAAVAVVTMLSQHVRDERRARDGSA